MSEDRGYYDSSNDKVTIKVEFQFKKWKFLIRLQFKKNLTSNQSNLLKEIAS